MGIGGISVAIGILIFSPLYRKALLACVALLFFFLGMLRYEIVMHAWNLRLPRDFYGSSRTLDGYIVSSVNGERSRKVFIETSDYGGALITTSLYPVFSYGERVSITGVVEDPLTQYPYRESLWVRGAGFIMYFPQVVVKEFAFQFSVIRELFSLREALEEKLKSLYAEPYNALADGMLFGSTNGIDKSIYDAFRRSGTSHILVLSGFNISVVAAFLLFILQFVFRRRYVIVGAMIGVVLFTIMTGFGAPAVRAALMALIGLLGFYTGRQYRADIALLWAVFFMLLLNPLLLRWDAGFQLSVAATLGIMFIAPWIDLYSTTFIPIQFLRSMISTTIGAQIAVLPFFVWWGVSISSWSIVANMLVVPLVSFIMAFSALAILCAFVSHTLALVIALPAFLLMKWQIMIALYFGV